MRHTAKQKDFKRANQQQGLSVQKESGKLHEFHVLVISLELQRPGGDIVMFTEVPMSVIVRCKYTVLPRHKLTRTDLNASMRS